MTEKKEAKRVKLDLKIENLRPEIRDILYDTMCTAIHRIALTQVLNNTYTLFRQSCADGGPNFTVQGVWNSLQETTRDHFVNHALDAIDHVGDVLLDGGDPRAPAPMPKAAPAVVGAIKSRTKAKQRKKKK